NLMCSQIDIDLRIDDKVRKIFHSTPENKAISLSFSTLNPIHMHEPLDSDYLLNAVNSMADSINFFTASTINRNTQSNDTFQVKRKLIGEERYEQILTPDDRDHQRKYLDYNKDATKIYRKIDVSYGEVYLEGKAMFELLYN